MKLAETQAWFYELVTARAPVVETVAARGPEARRLLEEIVNGDARSPAVARVEIYADMYFARLRDVLRDEYPKTRGLLGPSAFHDLVADYLTEEVLVPLPADTRRLLTEASVAEQVTASMVDAVTGRHDGARVLTELD